MLIQTLQLPSVFRYGKGEYIPGWLFLQYQLSGPPPSLPSYQIKPIDESLKASLRQRRVYTDSASLSSEECAGMIFRRIESVDFEAARADVAAFIPDPRDLDVWSRDYFHHVLSKLEFQHGATKKDGLVKSQFEMAK